MNLIICAMKNEISEILNSINAELIKDDLFEIYKHKNFIFIISGIGTINANICLTYILIKFDNIKNIYNFGVVGSLSETVPVFQIIYVKKFYWFLNSKIHKINCLTNIGFPVIHETLLTSDFFIQYNYWDNVISKFSTHPTILKNIIFPTIADMEFGAYYYVAKKFKRKIFSVKIVSDYVNNRSNENEYKKNMIYCKQMLKRIFFEIFMKDL